MSDQTQREAKWARAVWVAMESEWPSAGFDSRLRTAISRAVARAVIALADQEQAELRARLATVGDQANRLAETLTEETAKRRAAQERLRAVEALAWVTQDICDCESFKGKQGAHRPECPVAVLQAALASPVESDAEGGA